MVTSGWVHSHVLTCTVGATFFLLFEISERMFHMHCWTIGTESECYIRYTHRRHSNLIYNN
jgi:hypothetical protein